MGAAVWPWRVADKFGAIHSTNCSACGDAFGPEAGGAGAHLAQLAWEWTRRMPVEERVACDLLVRLAATQTGLLLYDLGPGVSALAAASLLCYEFRNCL